MTFQSLSEFSEKEQQLFKNMLFMDVTCTHVACMGHNARDRNCTWERFCARILGDLDAECRLWEEKVAKHRHIADEEVGYFDNQQDMDAYIDEIVEWYSNGDE